MKKYAFLTAIVLTLIVCIYAYFQLLLPLDVFLWDEAHHGFYGMRIYNDLRAGDWGAFWATTNHQALWMPLHSWLDGIFLLIFGFSYTSARLSSLFLFFICSIIVYLIGFELSKDKGWLVGLIAAFFYLTSPALLHLAVLNMQEMLGIFICLLTVHFIVHYLAVEVFWKYLIIGLLLGVAYWAKQNYAAIVVLGVAVYQLSLLWDLRKIKIIPAEESNEKIKSKKHRNIRQNEGTRSYFDVFRSNQYFIWLYDNVLILTGFLSLFLLWWMTPPFDRKYALAVTFRQGSVASGGLSQLSGLFKTAAFYLQSIITTYNFSLWIALGCLAAFIASCFYYRDKRIRIISLMLFVNLVFTSIMSFAQERYISTAVPLIFVLFGYFSVVAFEKIKNMKTAALIYLLLSFLALSVAYDLTALTRYTKEVGNRSIMFLIYKDSVNRFNPPFMFGLIKRPNITFPEDFTKNKYKEFNELPRSGLKDVLDFYRSNIDKKESISTMISLAQISPYVIYWHFHDWEAPVLTVNDLGFGNRYFWFANYFLELDVPPESPYYADLLEKRWDDIRKKLLNGGYIKLEVKKEFPDLGLTAKIYKRTGFINIQ